MESAIEVGSNFPEERGEEFLHTSRTFTKDAESWRGEEHSEQRSQKQEGDNFEESEEELRDFVEMCIEAFNEVDVDATELIGTEQLGVVLGELVDQEVIPPYNDEDLTILACDMDVEGNGFIPRREFLDVVLRWAKGYKMTADKHGKLSFTFLGPPPVDFTATELEEAFNLFDVKRTGAIEVPSSRSSLHHDLMLPAGESHPIRHEGGRRHGRHFPGSKEDDRSGSRRCAQREHLPGAVQVDPLLAAERRA
eukprot:748956-Hanusia_phi.AAC.3